MKQKIIGIGEALWDCLPEGSKLGGAPANFAYHVSQYGYNACAISALGNDALGDETKNIFKRNHMKYIMPVVNYPTGTVQVTLDDEGVPTYDIKNDVAWDNIPFTPDIEAAAQQCRAVCFGSLAQRSEVSRTTINRFLDATPEKCLKIFYTKDVICESMHRANILKINDEELVTIGRLFGYPGLDIENKCWLLLGKYNLDMLVLTCGVNGSYVFAPDHKSFFETPHVEVADTVGAGDSFTASFVAAILAGKSIEEAHRLAVDVSAYVCTCDGAMPVIPREYLDRIK